MHALGLPRTGQLQLPPAAQSAPLDEDSRCARADAHRGGRCVPSGVVRLAGRAAPRHPGGGFLSLERPEDHRRPHRQCARRAARRALCARSVRAARRGVRSEPGNVRLLEEPRRLSRHPSAARRRRRSVQSRAPHRGAARAARSAGRRARPGLRREALAREESAGAAAGVCAPRPPVSPAPDRRRAPGAPRSQRHDAPLPARQPRARTVDRVRRCARARGHQGDLRSRDPRGHGVRPPGGRGAGRRLPGVRGREGRRARRAKLRLRHGGGDRRALRSRPRDNRRACSRSSPGSGLSTPCSAPTRCSSARGASRSSRARSSRSARAAPEAPQPNHRLGKKARALGSGCSKANERRRHRRQRRSLRSSASPVRVAASASTTLQKIRFASGTRRGGMAR